MACDQDFMVAVVLATIVVGAIEFRRWKEGRQRRFWMKMIEHQEKFDRESKER